MVRQLIRLILHLKTMIVVIMSQVFVCFVPGWSLYSFIGIYILATFQNVLLER